MTSTASATPENQIPSASMVNRNAATSRAPDTNFLALAMSRGPAVPVIALGVIASAVLFWIVASASSEPLLLTALAVLATLGLLFLFGWASGVFGISEPDADALIATEALDKINPGVLVTKPDGTIVYENGAAKALIGTFGHSVVSRLEAAAASSDTNAAEAIFRMASAASRNGYAREDLSIVKRRLKSADNEVTLRVEVRPLLSTHRPEGVAGNTHPLRLWTINDVTGERAEIKAAQQEAESQLAALDALPFGTLAIDRDGFLIHANDAALSWLSLNSAAAQSRRTPLSDLMTRESLSALYGALSDQAGHTAVLPKSIDVDLFCGSGRMLRARLVVQPSALTPEGGLFLAILDRSSLTSAQAAAGTPSHLFNCAPFGMATAGPNGRIVAANDVFGKLTAFSGPLTGEPVTAVLCQYASADQRRAFDEALSKAAAGEAGIAPLEIPGNALNDITLRVYFSAIASSQGIEAAALYVVDVTEQKGLETRFAQSQKMEAVGKLAGGIAHDFNNVLTSIIGFSDLLLQTHRKTDAAYKDIMNIKSSANRAAALVSNLLGFSRQQTQKMSLMHLGETVSDLQPMLKTSVGEKVELISETERDLWYVQADPAQIANVIINLSVNARDAMPGGGKLTIRTRNVSEREAVRLKHPGLAAGEYVLIEVEDTGTGMSPEVMAKIFEPFFTTKAVGKGTGLGLASVYGIVKQSGGYIFPQSDIGKGTVFRVYLPRHIPEERDDNVTGPATSKVPAPIQEEHKPADLTGAGRVLLVEDEDIVRSFAVRALKRQGYQVLEASDGREALDIMESEDGRIDIVVSDVVMPEMDGPTLLKELRKKNPALKIIFVSGYPNDAFRQSLGEEHFAFLPKPFSLPQLAAKVKEELTS